MCFSELAWCTWESIMPWHACALPVHCWTCSTRDRTSLWLSTPRRMDRELVSSSWQLWIKPLQTFAVWVYVFISLDKHLGEWLWGLKGSAYLCNTRSAAMSECIVGMARPRLGLPNTWRCQASMMPVAWLWFPRLLRSRITSATPFPSVDALWWSIKSGLSLLI